MKIPTKFLLTLFLCCSTISFGQSIFGKWKTIDDRTGKPKGLIEIYKKEGQMYGKILEVLEEGTEGQEVLCTKCDGDMKDKPVIGMHIIKNGKKNEDGEWKGKYLFDPEQAMTFRFKIWLNPDNSNELKVRGYLAFIYRTQTWVRAEG